MAREIFVDASAWVALAETDDNRHAAAAEIYPYVLNEYQRQVTTNLVIAETYVILRNDLGHSAAFQFLEQTRNSPRLDRVHSTLELETRAEAILRQYDDQDFSYTDAVSFALMQARGIKAAFAFDKHFLVMRFQCVPADQK